MFQFFFSFLLIRDLVLWVNRNFGLVKACFWRIISLDSVCVDKACEK